MSKNDYSSERSQVENRGFLNTIITVILMIIPKNPDTRLRLIGLLVCVIVIYLMFVMKLSSSKVHVIQRMMTKQE